MHLAQYSFSFRLFAGIAFAVLAAFSLLALSPIMNPDASQACATAKHHDFNFTHSAYRTCGKGYAYWEMSDRSPATKIVYKTRIKGNRLYVTGTMNCNGKRLVYKNKAFKLTLKTKYYKHVGNGTFYEKSTKKRMTKLFKGGSEYSGGDLCLIVKKGQVKVLSAS